MGLYVLPLMKDGLFGHAQRLKKRFSLHGGGPCPNGTSCRTTGGGAAAVGPCSRSSRRSSSRRVVFTNSVAAGADRRMEVVAVVVLCVPFPPSG
jgi:hypothetical protein